MAVFVRLILIVASVGAAIPTFAQQQKGIRYDADAQLCLQGLRSAIIANYTTLLTMCLKELRCRSMAQALLFVAQKAAHLHGSAQDECVAGIDEGIMYYAYATQDEEFIAKVKLLSRKVEESPGAAKQVEKDVEETLADVLKTRAKRQRQGR